MTEVVFLDGRLLPAARALLPVADRALTHGFGLYETLRVRGGRARFLPAHLARLKRSARRFGLALPRVAASLPAWIDRLCRRNGIDDAAVRIVLTAGDGRRPGSLILRARPTPAVPRSWMARGARIRLAPWTRDPASPLAGHKTLNVLDAVIARDEGRRRGFAETLFLAPDGRLLEGSVSNLFLVKRGTLVTPALRGILPGVTRQALISLARKSGIGVRERDCDLSDVVAADEAFVCNALIGVLPAGSIGSRRWRAPGPVTAGLSSALDALSAT